MASNNQIILSGCIDAYKESNGLQSTESEAFELFSLAQATKEFDLTFEEIEASIVDGGNDGGIDSLLVLVDDEPVTSVEDLEAIKFNAKTQVVIIISQCKKEKSFKESSIDKLITTVPELFSLDKSEDALLQRFNPDLVDIGIVARTAWKGCMVAGGKLRIVFNHCAFAEEIEVTGTFNGKVAQLLDLAEKHFVGAETSYDNYSSAELLKRFQIQRNQRLSLTFKENPLSTSYKGVGIGYVGTVKLGDYRTFITDESGDIRDDVFESNIRHFQGKVDVNKKIAATIKNEGSEDFWWLNNGITIIATNPALVGPTLSMDDVQIVNGLQTSYSIFNNHTGDPDDTRSVLVKVVLTDDKMTIDHIIASTNSQNAVSPILLRATDDVQRNLEMFFANAGYFYDRRKNYYRNQGKPASRIFSIQTTAQSIEAILFNSPHTARSKPTTLVKDDVAYQRIFDPDKNFQAYLNCCLILKKTNEFWGHLEHADMKARLANFKLHLARVATSVLLTTASANAEGVTGLDVEKYDGAIFAEAMEQTLAAIDTYQKEHPDANLINMAKAGGLTQTLMSELETKYGNP